eukprot:scpid71531/ scgid9050/ Frizzled-10
MAERLTLLVTCFVVLSNSALVVPGRDLSGSRLLDDWNLFPREEGCVPMHSRYGAMCAGFGYNTTRPVGAAGFNFLHHGSQAEASQQLESFSRLVDTGCSRDLLFLLCAYHFPICNENLMEPITPCRNLCEQVVTNCTPTLLGAGRRWPETINCSDLLTESRLDGARRMHVCVSTTSELEQATRETPVDPRPNPPPQPIQTPAVVATPKPQPKPVVSAPVKCPACKTNKIKKKILKKAKFTWLFMGDIVSAAVVKGKRICYKVDITQVFYSHCDNPIHPSAANVPSQDQNSTVNVCILRAAPTCQVCPPERTFSMGRTMFFGGKTIRSGRYVIDLNDYPLFLPYKASLVKKIPKWVKKFYKKRCPS